MRAVLRFLGSRWFLSFIGVALLARPGVVVRAVPGIPGRLDPARDRHRGDAAGLGRKTIVSSLAIISRALFECPVLKLPSCPVFIACSMSIASPPRTSPTTIRLGRIRSEALINSRMVISPFPSVFVLRVSKETRFGTVSICSSAESSIVTIRSSEGINCDKAFKKVVLPEPVPPLMKILYLAATS